MGRIRQLWNKWASGFVDQTQYQADSETLLEYERICEEFGPDSKEAQEMRPEVDAVHARRRPS